MESTSMPAAMRKGPVGPKNWARHETTGAIAVPGQRRKLYVAHGTERVKGMPRSRSS